MHHIQSKVIHGNMRRRKNSVPFGVFFVAIVIYSVTSAVLLLYNFRAPSSIIAQLVTPLAFDSPMIQGVQNEAYIFIGIKTSETGVHAERLTQIQKTWLRDAFQSQDIELKLFTHHKQANISKDASSDMVMTKCKRQDLACKTGQVFAYYIQHSNAPWFCAADDDNYVNIPRLIEVLHDYERNNRGKDLYIGSSLHPNGMHFDSVNATVSFSTGGSGYCLNRDLVLRGKDLFSSLESFHLIDDVAVGYVSQVKLGVNVTSDPLFHSHWNRMIRDKMPHDDIDKQVSFAHDNKGDHEFPFEDLPSTPTLFPREEDPMGFRSLWCFLHRNDGKDLPECTPTLVAAS
jgi:hypothetical protein